MTRVVAAFTLVMNVFPRRAILIMADRNDPLVKDLVQGLAADGGRGMHVHLAIHTDHMLDPTGDESQIVRH